MRFLLPILLSFIINVCFSSEFGICVKNCVSVHKSANKNSEQVTQLIFGDTYKILSKSKDKKWVFIENQFDSYQGWISISNHQPLSEPIFLDMKKGSFPVCAELKGKIEYEGKTFEISLGSTLPYYENGMISINGKKAKFFGKVISIPQKFDRSKLVSTSKLCLEIPYLWGGKNAFGYDCSGFVQTIFKTFGIFLPRDSGQQIKLGKEITFDDAKIGDLAFFHENGKIVHVGIVIEEGKIIHASKKVKINKLDKTGIWVDETQSYSHYLKCIKRIAEQ